MTITILLLLTVLRTIRAVGESGVVIIIVATPAATTAAEGSATVAASPALGLLADLFDVPTSEGRRIEFDTTEEHGFVDVFGLGHFVVEGDRAVVFEVGHVADVERAGVGGAGDVGGVFEDSASEALRVFGVDLKFLV